MPGLLESDVVVLPTKQNQGEVRSVSLRSKAEQFDREELIRHVSREIKRETNLGVQEMQVRFENGVVVLSGYCRTFYTKQLAQQAVMKVLGEIKLINQIRVH